MKVKQEYKFIVEGSTGSLYKTNIIIDGRMMKASCDCAAGKSGTMCKHRTGILHGKEDRIKEGDKSALNTIHQAFLVSDLAEFLKDQEKIKKQKDKAKKDVDKKQKAILECLDVTYHMVSHRIKGLEIEDLASMKDVVSEWIEAKKNYDKMFDL